MTTHKIRTLPEPFEASQSGVKNYEIRIKDRLYQVGDEVVLMEYFPDKDDISGRQLSGVITHITHGGVYGIDKKYVVFQLDFIPSWKPTEKANGSE